MKVIVQKFGGTSVKDADSRKQAVSHVKKANDDGYKVVAVVSAMGRKGDPYATDTLLGLINKELASDREQDLLLSCGETISSVVFSNLLNQNGMKACAMTGAEAGFRTSNEHLSAKIQKMECEKLQAALNDHDVVVVAGFQGISNENEITTLGRGGSDTSAAALGVALDAAYVDIFTDVEGIMTADPRIVDDARPLSEVTYNEICNMAHQGAKVIHPRAVEIAMQAEIPLRVRSTYSDSEGTFVGTKKGVVQERLVTGIANVANITQIKVTGAEDQYNIQQEVFKAMANEGISVDFINISINSIIYTINESMTDQAISALTKLGYDVSSTKGCAKVSAVGAGMTGVPGVTAKIVNALAIEGIKILQSADSHTTIWVLVKEEDMTRAVNALHKAFKLEKEVDNQSRESLL